MLLPEAEDARVISAARYMAAEGIAHPVLVGGAFAGSQDLAVLDPATHPRREEWEHQLFEQRRGKGLTAEEARSTLRDPLGFAVAALRAGLGDVLVAGAVRTTAETVRAGLAGLGRAPGAEAVFGAFLMECPHAVGGPRTLLFADAAVSPHPSPRRLGAIGHEAARLFSRWTGEAPRVAFLSFSTAGSAEDESVTAVREALAHFRRLAPGIEAAGEIQGDAALVPDIARQKGAGGGAAGGANVLVFPDLNAGNIGYKLVQHLGGARAVGPVLSGLSRPMSDLSRGCTDEDVVDAAALAALLCPERGREPI